MMEAANADVPLITWRSARDYAPINTLVVDVARRP